MTCFVKVVKDLSHVLTWYAVAMLLLFVQSEYTVLLLLYLLCIWWNKAVEKKNPGYWPFVRGPVSGEFPAQRPVTWSFEVFLIYVWIHGWVNNRDAGDFRRYPAHYDVTVMMKRMHWPPMDSSHRRSVTQILYWPNSGVSVDWKCLNRYDMDINETKRNTTKRCAYFVWYTLHWGITKRFITHPLARSLDQSLNQSINQSIN